MEAPDRATVWSIGLWSVSMCPLLPWARWYNDPLLAPWVQAFGSIAVIISGFALAAWQTAKARELQHQARHEAKFRAAQRMWLVAMDAAGLAADAAMHLSHAGGRARYFSSEYRQQEFDSALGDLKAVLLEPSEAGVAWMLTRSVRNKFQSHCQRLLDLRAMGAGTPEFAVACGYVGLDAEDLKNGAERVRIVMKQFELDAGY